MKHTLLFDSADDKEKKVLIDLILFNSLFVLRRGVSIVTNGKNRLFFQNP